MRLFLTFIFGIVFGIIQAQYQNFDKIYELDGINEVYKDVYVTDSSYIAVGVRNTEETFQVLREHNLEGEIIRTKFFSPAVPGFYILGGYEQTFKFVTSESNFIMCGSADVGDGFQGYVVKYNTDLDSTFTRLFNTFDQGGIRFTSFFANANDIVVSAFSWDLSMTPYRGSTSLVKISSTGEIIWNSTLKPFVEDILYTTRNIDKTVNGYLIGDVQRVLTGPGTGQGNYSPTVTKTNLEGEIEWEFIQEYLAWEGAAEVMCLSNGDIISESTRVTDVWEMFPSSEFFYSVVILRKHDPETGVVVEETTLLDDNVMLHGGAHKMIETNDGGLLIVGDSHTNDIDFRRYTWLLKLDANWEQEWYQEYYREDFIDLATQDFWDLEKAPDGGYIMAGSANYISGVQKSWLLKVDACGYVEWDTCPPVGIVEIDNPNANIHIWPNPTSDFMHVAIQGNQKAMQYSLLNIDGKTVLQETLDFYGSNEFIINVNDLSTGLYLLKILHENGSYSTKKIIVE